LWRYEAISFFAFLWEWEGNVRIWDYCSVPDLSSCLAPGPHSQNSSILGPYPTQKTSLDWVKMSVFFYNPCKAGYNISAQLFLCTIMNPGLYQIW
jgi:hypothetical protein